MVVASKKIPVNFTLPESIRDEFERMAEGYGGKQKWIVISAAIGLLAEKKPGEIKEIVGEVVAADTTDRLAEWLESRRPPIDISDTAGTAVSRELEKAAKDARKRRNDERGFK